MKRERMTPAQLKAQDMEFILERFIEQVNLRGGVRETYDEDYVLDDEHLNRWVIADLYVEACSVLGKNPKIKEDWED